MKITELRVGNWVKRDYQPDGFQVDVNSFIVCARDPEMYQPIPLTEEWLLKFGFEKDGNKIYRNGRFFIENLFRNRMTFRITINNAESAHTNSIEYVHQLQNLYFALTGTELEMK